MLQIDFNAKSTSTSRSEKCVDSNRFREVVCKVRMDLKNDSVAFPFPSPPLPQSSYSTLVGVIGIYIYELITCLSLGYTCICYTYKQMVMFIRVGSYKIGLAICAKLPGLWLIKSRQRYAGFEVEQETNVVHLSLSLSLSLDIYI